MKTRAAVALEKGKPLTVTEVELDGPKASEVLVEVKATGICHTDEFTLSGADPEGLFPAILGHEGAGIVVDVGPGVTSVKKGDHVIPLYTPECRQCPSCHQIAANLFRIDEVRHAEALAPLLLGVVDVDADIHCFMDHQADGHSRDVTLGQPLCRI